MTSNKYNNKLSAIKKEDDLYSIMFIFYNLKIYMLYCLYCNNQFSTRQSKFVHMKNCSKNSEAEKRPIQQISKPTPFSAEVQTIEKKRKADMSLSASITSGLENIALRMLRSKTKFDKDFINSELKNVNSLSNFYKATSTEDEKDDLRQAILKVSDDTLISSTNSILNYENFVKEIKQEIQFFEKSAECQEFEKSLAKEKKDFITEIRKIQCRTTGKELTRGADGSIPDDAVHSVSFDEIIERKEKLRLERLLLEFKENFLGKEEAYRLNWVKNQFSQLSVNEFTVKEFDPNSKSQNY